MNKIFAKLKENEYGIAEDSDGNKYLFFDADNHNAKGENKEMRNMIFNISSVFVDDGVSIASFDIDVKEIEENTYTALSIVFYNKSNKEFARFTYIGEAGAMRLQFYVNGRYNALSTNTKLDNGDKVNVTMVYLPETGMAYVYYDGELVASADTGKKYEYLGRLQLDCTTSSTLDANIDNVIVAVDKLTFPVDVAPDPGETPDPEPDPTPDPEPDPTPDPDEPDTPDTPEDPYEPPKPGEPIVPGDDGIIHPEGDDPHENTDGPTLEGVLPEGWQ